MQSLWMLPAGLCFAGMGVFVKLGAQYFTTAELVFYRSALSVVAMYVVMRHRGVTARTTRLGMHFRRGVLGFVTMVMFFFAMAELPLATASGALVSERPPSFDVSPFSLSRLRRACRNTVIPLNCKTVKAILTLTNRGVVTLPAKLRHALGLRADDQLIAETTPEGLLLRPAVTLPVEIYTEKRIREFDEAEAELAKVLNRRSRPKKSAR
jgi:bifunctional DNA-binding transcriptional regulator/antitoxin component of YhaV-PrlF toxin-antitoxin module